MSTSKLIEKKEWEYYIYEMGGQIELSICIASPSPGFDVKYVLNEDEIKQYKANGVTALQDRIADMELNYTKYRMICWR